jgi:hypothetical protein
MPSTLVYYDSKNCTTNAALMSEFTFWIWQRVLHLLECQYLCYRIEEALFLPTPATLITNPVQTQCFTISALYTTHSLLSCNEHWHPPVSDSLLPHRLTTVPTMNTNFLPQPRNFFAMSLSLTRSRNDLWRLPTRSLFSGLNIYPRYTECGRNNSHIL